MDEYLAANRRSWDRAVAAHVRSEFYDVASFKAGHSTLKSIEVEELGDVAGKSLLHLMCHFGLDTLSWARRGARVTGADFSPKAIEAARALAAECGIDARFVESNVYDLPSVLDDRFDVVFTSYGVKAWLPDLPGWAKVIDHFLKPGGTFYIVEHHPFSCVFDDESDELRLRYPYWRSDDPERFETEYTYGSYEKLEKRVNYEWGHSLGEIVTSLIEAGLRIEYLHEFPVTGYRQMPYLVQSDDGWWRLPDHQECLPLLFSIKATRP